MTTTEKTEIAPPLNHVLVDFENVQDIDLSIIGSKSVTFTLLVGAKQPKMDMVLVEKLLKHAANVQLIRLEQPGKDAVDFAPAYYLGRAILTDPTGWFHIVSKDTGYDSLIAHLRSRHIKARRHADFTSLNFHAPAKPANPPGDPLLEVALSHLKRNVSNRPKRRTTLTSHLQHALGNGSGESDISGLIDQLLKAGHLSIDPKGIVTYTL